MLSRRFTLSLLSLALILVLQSVTIARTAPRPGSFGKITGTVVDLVTNNPIAGATVLLVERRMIVVTDSLGKFLFTTVPPGNYSMVVMREGFEDLEITALSVTAATTSRKLVSMSRIAPEPEPTVGELDFLRGLVDEEKNLRQEFGIGITADIARLPRSRKMQIGRYAPIPSPIHWPGHDTRGGFPPAHGGNAIVNNQAFDAMFFKHYGVNPFVDPEDDNLSTFAIDIDDASFVMVRSYLNRGYLPPEEAVRTEEFINHFKYDYTSSDCNDFKLSIDGAPSPFGPKNSYIIKFGIQGRIIEPKNRKPANLVIVVDVSGSMARENRLGLVRKALRLLVDQLQPKDQIGIVVYGSNGQVWLEPTSLLKKDRIIAAIERLATGGATNAEEGIRLGYQMADRQFDPSRINRVILCSDGVANVGQTGPEQILSQIKLYAKKGITLTTVGFGMGNYNDVLMEQLANKGNGQYAYVQTISDARRLFVENLTGTLQVVARDVKIQVEFDPQTVRSYRLLGYENRDIANKDFRNDKVDGGEIGSGHQVTALYEVKLNKYNDNNRLGSISIRWADPEEGRVIEINRPISLSDLKPDFEICSWDTQLAVAAAEFAEILRKSYWARGSELSRVRKMVQKLSTARFSADTIELLSMISSAEQLSKELVVR